MSQLSTKKDWRDKFLKALAKSGNVAASCRLANISQAHVYTMRKENQQFANEWAAAIDQAIDALEAVAFSRAKRNSDTLLIFLLKSHRPEKYRENLKVEHSGSIAINHYESASQAFERFINEGTSAGTTATIPSDTDARTES